MKNRDPLLEFAGGAVPLAVTVATANPLGLAVSGAVKGYAELSGSETIEGAAQRTAHEIAVKIALSDRTSEHNRLSHVEEFLVKANPGAPMPLPSGWRTNDGEASMPRTLKENLLLVRHFETIEELRLALLDFAAWHDTYWLVARHGHRTPAQIRADQQPAMDQAA